MKKKKYTLLLSIVISTLCFANILFAQTDLPTNDPLDERIILKGQQYIVKFAGMDDPVEPVIPEARETPDNPYGSARQMPSRAERLDRAALVRMMAAEFAEALGISEYQVYDYVLFGFSAKLTASQIERLRADRRIENVIPATTIYEITQVQNDTASWGLDRIDERTKVLDNRYFFWNTAIGTNIFIMDTGVRATHVDLAGRVAAGRNFDGGAPNATNDCNGHGTHVAGTAAGTIFGVAKGATIHPVKVNTGCSGQLPVLNALGGINWVTGQLTGGQVTNAVVNMSFGWNVTNPLPVDTLMLEMSIVNAINSGVSVVVAAGNDDSDACTKTPARIPQVITVGASTRSDSRADFSNFGTCIDIFAPGKNIVSAGIISDTDRDTMDGTSMAAPHVAGVVALHREFAPGTPPAVVRNLVVNDATRDVISDAGTGSPNRLLYWYRFFYWNYISGNNGNYYINGWYIQSADKFTPGDYTGDGRDDLLAIHPNGWHHTMAYNGSAWNLFEGNGSGNIGGWVINAPDRYLSGDFNQDGRDEMLAINPANGWHGTMRYNGASWGAIESGGGGNFGGWQTNGNDRYLAGDFNGDSRDEVLAINPANGWHATMRYNGSSWGAIEVGSGGWISGWRTNGNDSYAIGDFNGDGRDDLLAVNPNGWHHVISFNGSSWQTISGDGSGQIAGWLIASPDRYLTGDFNQDGRDELLTINPSNGWSSTMRYDGSNFQFLTSNSGGGRLGGWIFNSNDWYLSGKFNGGTRDLLMGVNPSGWWQTMNYQ